MPRKKCPGGHFILRFCVWGTHLGGTLFAMTPDPNKVTAIRVMAALTNTTELRQYLGMIKQLSKFTPNIAELQATSRVAE